MQPNASIEQDHRAKLAARQDIVADADGFEIARLEDALVETFEAAAQEDRSAAGGESADAGLGQRSAARGQRKHRAAIGDAVQRGSEHVGPQHHPRPAAGRRVVDAAVLVGGEVADLAGVERPQTVGQGPARQAQPQRPGKHLRVEGQDSSGEWHGSGLVRNHGHDNPLGGDG